MKAKIMGMGDLFDRDVSYRIPAFQRPYAWQEEEWEALWGDVKNVARKLLSRPGSPDVLPHFLGAIVVQPRDGSASFGDVQPVLVVDGQQRLTTLQLLFKALAMEFTAAIASPPAAYAFHDYLFNEASRIGGDHLNATKIRQSNLLDQADFHHIINEVLDPNRALRPIVEAYRYFQGNVRQWLNDDPLRVSEKAQALHDVVTEYLKVATIELDRREQPHFTFEILNSRGEPLKQADYIKNTVMYEADVIDDENQARALWGMFEDDWWREEDSRGRDLQMQLDRFLNYWCMMRIGKYIPTRNTAAAFREHVEKAKEQSQSIEAIAADVRKVGIVYKNIEENRQPGIEEALGRIKALEIGVIMPPLLWLYTEDVSEESRQSAVGALESFLVRRVLCGLGTMGLNYLFIDLVDHLSKSADEPADEVVIDYLSKQTAENRIWPSDKRVVEYLTNWPMPGNTARRKMVLETIERSKRSPMTESLSETSKLTVEHLLPQGWTQAGWPLPNPSVEATEARNEFIGLIGNLTLATRQLNSSMANRSWKTKRAALGQYSTLVLNKEVLESASDEWDERAIEKRSEELAKVITQIWSHPATR